MIQESTEFVETQADGFQKSRLFGVSCEIMLLGEFVPIIWRSCSAGWIILSSYIAPNFCSLKKSVNLT